MFVLVMFLCSSIYYIYIHIYIAVVHLQVGITVDSEDPLTYLILCSPSGCPPPLGLRFCQKMEWLMWPPPLNLTAP